MAHIWCDHAVHGHHVIKIYKKIMLTENVIVCKYIRCVSSRNDAYEKRHLVSELTIWVELDGPVHFSLTF